MQPELPLLIDVGPVDEQVPGLPAGVRIREILLGGRLVRYAFRRARRRTIGSSSTGTASPPPLHGG